MSHGSLLWDLDRIDWQHTWTAMGSGVALPDVLRDLSSVDSVDSGWEIYWQLDNVVVVQNTLYPAAEQVVPFAVRLAASGDDLPSMFALELLIQIAAGESDPASLLDSDRGLGDRCRSLIRGSIELLYGLVASPNPEIRARALHVVDLVEVDRERLRWAVDQVGRSERHPLVLKSLQEIRKQ
jgi:hypothetical protein